MNKDEERLYLTRFCDLRTDLCVSDIRASERPDFICTADGIVTGVEVTRFFFPATGGISPQAVNRYRDQLSQALCTEHSRRGLPPLHASIHLFSEDKLLARATRSHLVDALLNFVQTKIPEMGRTVEFDDLPPALSELGVNCISLIRVKALTRPTWSLPYASYIPESHSALVQAIITGKSDLAAKYREKAAFLWLLIVSGTSGLHSIVDFDGDILTASYASAFDRVFLFRTFGPSVHELKRV
jgi:hypothetical protein